MSKIKRFYKNVKVNSQNDNLCILLDDHTVKTTEKFDLAIPTKPLADEMAKEWEAQEEHIIPDTMPLTQLMMTAIDAVSQQRSAMEDEIIRYFGTELIAYPSDGREALQIDMEQKFWHPLYQWLTDEFGITLKLATGIIHVEQDADAVSKMHKIMSNMSDIDFTVFQFLVSVTGSFVIPLALIQGRIDSKTAYQAAMLEQIFQLEQWGDDYDAQKRLDYIAVEIAHAEKFLKLAQEI